MQEYELQSQLRRLGGVGYQSVINEFGNFVEGSQGFWLIWVLGISVSVGFNFVFYILFWIYLVALLVLC